MKPTYNGQQENVKLIFERKNLGDLTGTCLCR